MTAGEMLRQRKNLTWYEVEGRETMRQNYIRVYYEGTDREQALKILIECKKNYPSGTFRIVE